MIYIIIISILNLLVAAYIIFILINNIRQERIKGKIINSWGYNKLSEYICLIIKRNLLPSKMNKLNPIKLLVIMLVLFIFSFLIFNSYIKVISTSVILSLPFFLSPILFIKVLLNKEKANIIKILPMYVVNIKNHISEDNNIISAMQRTIVEQPLKKYIDIFKINISRGMNVIEAFDILKQDVSVKSFTTFINACQVCYLNGGNFNKVLERYIDMITKENIHKESTKQKAYSDILTLIILIALNILVIVMFVFTNKEYAVIMRETFLGKLILNFNAISYILIAYLISKIYKEE